MLFCIGIGMVIGMLVTENVIIIISAGLCLLCGYHMFCRWYYWQQAAEVIITRTKARDTSRASSYSFILMKWLCSFYFSGSQTRSTYIHLLCTAVSCFNFNGFYIGFPHFIGSSMGMTYIISEISTFFTNCAFSHDSTSLTLFFNRFYSTRWSQFLQVKKTENRKILFRTSKTGRNIAVFRQYLLYEQNRMYRYDFLWKLQKCYERA